MNETTDIIVILPREVAKELFFHGWLEGLDPSTWGKKTILNKLGIDPSTEVPATELPATAPTASDPVVALERLRLEVEQKKADNEAKRLSVASRRAEVAAQQLEDRRKEREEKKAEEKREREFRQKQAKEAWEKAMRLNDDNDGRLRATGPLPEPEVPQIDPADSIFFR